MSQTSWVLQGFVLYCGAVLVTLPFAPSTVQGQQTQESVPFQDHQLSALFSPNVLRDLELVDGQQGELKIILGEIRETRDQLAWQFAEFSKTGASAEEIDKRRKLLQGQIETRKQEAWQQVKQVLLPHQIKRLKQATAQVMMQQFATTEKVSSGLLTEAMQHYLEIDSQQAAKIAKTARQLQEELLEEVRKLRAEATEKLLKELTAEQRKKYLELVGDPVKGIR